MVADAGRERMQKMEMQLESLSKWVHMNMTTTTRSTVENCERKRDEGLVSSSSGNSSSTMSSESPSH